METAKLLLTQRELDLLIRSIDLEKHFGLSANNASEAKEFERLRAYLVAKRDFYFKEEK